MERLDSIESIRKRYDNTLLVDDGNGKRIEAGVFAQWAFGFTDVTHFVFWVELPNHDGNLTPVKLGIKPHSQTDIRLVSKIGRIKIFNHPRPKNWNPKLEDM